MSTRHREHSNGTMVQAVETLTYLADMDLEQTGATIQLHHAESEDNKMSHSKVDRLSEEDAVNTVKVAKETFRVVLNYLRHFYKKQSGHIENQHTVEGIKTIMLLVGEAAKKIDKYRRLFQHLTGESVTDLKEYKRLQEFYRTRIAGKIDEGILGKWILALTKKAMVQNREILLIAEKSPQARHVFVDLESVKKDSEYELFFMRKEDGTRFFSPRLIRSMKLVCDFGNLLGAKAAMDPLINIGEWSDLYYQTIARGIVKSLGNIGDRFYREAYKSRDTEIVSAISKALMALMLCCNYHASMDEDYKKCCADYFKDFQVYLREALHTYDYHKWITYPLESSNVVARCCVKIVHALCKGLYLHSSGFSVLGNALDELLTLAKDEGKFNENERISFRLEKSYGALQKKSKQHGNGPLVKVLDVLQNGHYQAFDPLLQHNVPSTLYALSYGDDKVVNMLMPSPTVQEYIHKATVNDEFKGLLRACKNDENIRSVLLINLQDRTSWREHSRCNCLEDLQNNEEFGSGLTVVTLPKDTEFYHQLASYKEDNIAENFIAGFKHHIGDSGSGFYFPASIAKELTSSFIDGAIDAVHRIFFSNKNILIREHRLDFIEIFDVLLTLKIIEIAKPDTFSLLCKDGVDAGQSANILLYLFLYLVNHETLSKGEWQHLNQMLYLPVLLVRERIMLPERFNRMISALKTIEAAKHEMGDEAFGLAVKEAFGPLFKTPILSAVLTPTTN